MDTAGALHGIRVIGVEHFISAPFCTQILADQGADVIKVEPPAAEQRNGYFHTLNRNKRSVVLDLKGESGREALRALAATADVLVTNFAADVPTRLGFGYEDLAAVNPRLVYVHVTGFGQNSPYRSRPAFDGVIQAMSGMMHLTGEPDGPPMLSGLFIPDHLTGLYAALATSFALQRREATGTGSFVDLAMLDCLMSFLAGSFHEVLQHGIRPERIGSRVRGSFASTYRAADGYVYLAPLTARMWEAVSRVVGQPWFLEHFSTTSGAVDTRLDPETRPRLDGAIESWTSGQRVADVVRLMSEAGVAASPILAVEDLPDDPHVVARRMIRTVPHRGRGHGGSTPDVVYVAGSPIPVTESTFSVGPPVAGEHTAEILAELGLSPVEVTDISDTIPRPIGDDLGEAGMNERSVPEAVDGSGR